MDMNNMYDDLHAVIKHHKLDEKIGVDTQVITDSIIQHIIDMKDCVENAINRIEDEMSSEDD